MLNYLKHVPYVTIFKIQCVRRASDKKATKIIKLMKELKSVFGILHESSHEKKKRLKLQKKGKIAHQKDEPKIDTELSWVIVNNQQSKFRKITFPEQPVKPFVDRQSEYKVIKYKKNPIKPSKPFQYTILKIKKSTDQNVKDTFSSESNQDNQGERKEINIENSNCDLSKVTSDINHNDNKVTSIIKDSNCNSGESTVEVTSAKSNFPPLDRLPDIIIKNMLSFPIMGSQRKSTVKSTEMLPIPEYDNSTIAKFPSVTKILTQTMSLESKLALEAWKQKMIQKLGENDFDIYQKALLSDGSALHSCIAHNLLGEEFEISTRIKPLFKSVQSVLEDISYAKDIEMRVAHTKLRYKGIVDCVASYRGEYHVIDWKRSEKKKLNLKETYDGPIQLAAYIGAINASNVYPFVIKRGLLVIAYTCGSPATVHELCDNTLQQYWTMWLRRLQQYYVETASNDDNGNNKTLM